MTTLTTRQQALQLRTRALERANHACEGSPKYPNCRAREDRAHPETDKPVRLHVIDDRVMCDRCVLGYDFPLHQTKDWRGRRKAMNNHELFPIDEGKK